MYNFCFLGCCFLDLFYRARDILVPFLSSLISVDVVHPYSRIDTTAAWKKIRFILSDRPDFHVIDSLSIAVQAFGKRILMSLSVEEILLSRYVMFVSLVGLVSWYINYLI